MATLDEFTIPPAANKLVPANEYEKELESEPGFMELLEEGLGAILWAALCFVGGLLSLWIASTIFDSTIVGLLVASTVSASAYCLIFFHGWYSAGWHNSRGADLDTGIEAAPTLVLVFLVLGGIFWLLVQTFTGPMPLVQHISFGVASLIGMSIATWAHLKHDLRWTLAEDEE